MFAVKVFIDHNYALKCHGFMITVLRLSCTLETGSSQPIRRVPRQTVGEAALTVVFILVYLTTDMTFACFCLLN